MAALPDRPSIEHLRKQAKAYRSTHAVGLARAQHEIALSYGFASWPRLMRHVRARTLHGFERILYLAEPAELDSALRGESGIALIPVSGMTPLIVLLRTSAGNPSDVRLCAQLLLDFGADPNDAIDPGVDGDEASALCFAVRRRDLTLVQLLLAAGAVPDEDAFYHACEQGDIGYLNALYRPGFEDLFNHKLDFEDALGCRWFLDRGVDVNVQGSLHWAIGRGRGVDIVIQIIDAGADVNMAHPDVGARPLEVAARCGNLAAYNLLVARGATADLSPTGLAVLAVARGQSTQLPDEPPPLPGIPGSDYGWILGQFAMLGRTEVVRALLDAGVEVDSRGWSNFTPLDQAAMHGRVETVQLLIERGADLHDCAFDEDGPTPLDTAIWGVQNNWAPEGAHYASVRALVQAQAPTRYGPPTGDANLDLVLADYPPVP